MSTPPLATVPPLSLLMPFAVAFTAPTFRHMLVLVSGTILAAVRRPLLVPLPASLSAVGPEESSQPPIPASKGG